MGKSIDKERDLNIPWYNLKFTILKIRLIFNLGGKLIIWALGSIFITMRKWPLEWSEHGIFYRRF